jgi:hypothetical protein
MFLAPYPNVMAVAEPTQPAKVFGQIGEAGVQRFDDQVVGPVHPDHEVSAGVVEDAAARRPVPEIEIN